MTAVPDDGVARYFVLQRKGALFPEITVAAYRLAHLPVWNDRRPVDPSSMLAALEDAAVQVAFFGNEVLNATLERLVGAAHQLTDTIRGIQAGSRPGFGGKVEERVRAEDDTARRALDRASALFVEAARADLCIEGPWLPIHPQAALVVRPQ